ncbi:MAG TPA: L-2-amino-thiazoline-4-carboxylic acid hydrolase [Aggregatilineaceae bacterium]|nr:L-2-amino-thiazoline-4-carboxylic acid hydrolase [Aggregatilineaceae bacterium]
MADPSTEQRRANAVLFRKFIDQYGPGVLAILRENTIEETCQKYQQANIPTRDLLTLKAMLWDVLSDRFECVTEEATPTRLKMRVTRCPFADDMIAFRAADIGYALYCCYDYGFCQGFNPSMRFIRTTTLMQGDDCCDHTYELDE